MLRFIFGLTVTLESELKQLLKVLMIQNTILASYIHILRYILDMSALDFMLDVIFLSSSVCPFGVSCCQLN